MSEKDGLRVGFVVPYSKGEWLGGINYLRNLSNVLRVASQFQIDPVFFVRKNSDFTQADFGGALIVETSLLTKFSVSWYLRKVLRLISRRDLCLEGLLHMHRIAVLSHSFPLGSSASIPVVGWIPDFQHFYLPHLFDRKERTKRNRDMKLICDQSDCVVVSSESAAADLRNFFSYASAKVRVLRFAIDPKEITNATDLLQLEQKYSFPEKYFHLPNQFWAHKNHFVVIEALRILKNQGLDFTVVATGGAKDHRDLEFYGKIEKKIDDYGVDDNFIRLGVVPYSDLLGLMVNSVSVINPSFFEGWSSSVEEAKALGVPVIVSDIAVHREQDAPGSVYFDPNCPDQLANCMKEKVFMRGGLSVTDKKNNYSKNLDRWLDFGSKFNEIINEVEC